jgi:hypothetical protein
MIGWAARRSMTTNPASSTTPAVTKATLTGSVQPASAVVQAGHHAAGKADAVR